MTKKEKKLAKRRLSVRSALSLLYPTSTSSLSEFRDQRFRSVAKVDGLTNGCC